MNQILDALGASRYLAHSLCLTNDPLVMFLYVLSDFSTFLAYITIGLCLILFRGMPSPSQLRPSMKVLFGAFIFLCGLSHLTMVLTLFVGVYRLDVIVRAAMAGVSVATAVIVASDLVREKWGRA